MTAISGAFSSMRTMADGSVRIVVDLDCTLSAIAALNLMPGTPLAIARLTPEAGTAALQPEPEPAKGGALAKLAGMWCNDAHFQQWSLCPTPEEAANWIRNVCAIGSRAELDSNETAAMRFQEMIRLPYMAYCQGKNR